MAFRSLTVSGSTTGQISPQLRSGVRSCPSWGGPYDRPAARVFGERLEVSGRIGRWIEGSGAFYRGGTGLKFFSRIISRT